MDVRNQRQSLCPVQNERQGSLHLAFILDGFAVSPRTRLVLKPWMAGKTTLLLQNALQPGSRAKKKKRFTYRA